MKNTYFITDGQIEVDIGADYLLIKDHSKEDLSKSLVTMQKKVIVSFALSLLSFGVAFVIAYFSLYKVTIYCERNSLDVDVMCGVNKDYYIRGNIETLAFQPIKQARTVINTSSYTACHQEFTKLNGKVVFPVSYISSSGLCKTDFETKIKPFFDYRQHTGEQTLILSDNLVEWVAIVIFAYLGFYLGWLLPSVKLLLQVVFDRTERKITLTHVNVYRSYQKEYHFDEVIEVVYDGDSRRPDDAKSRIPDIDFYLQLIGFRKVYLYFNIDTTEKEKYELAHLIQQVLKS